MKTIKEVIVVEGKHDTAKLKQYFICDTLETSGNHLSSNLLKTISEINQTRGIILLLDPDHVGERLRHKINQAIPGLKNAFILKEYARTKKKVGIEHASYQDLENCLNNLVTYTYQNISLNYQDYLSLGLSGEIDSAKKREKVYTYFNLGQCNAKTLYQRILMKQLTKKELEEIL